MMASIISLIGAPGSGKGTYGALLASRRLKASFLSVGDILREQSDENEHLSSVMLSGALVEDDLVTELVIQSLENKRTGKNLIILDGFPRSGLHIYSLHLRFTSTYLIIYALLRYWEGESVTFAIKAGISMELILMDAICLQCYLGRVLALAKLNVTLICIGRREMMIPKRQSDRDFRSIIMKQNQFYNTGRRKDSF